ncbi:unnamed protein product [Mytilus edulis]|uniref:Uncharacterized protein n=1 Tax=Mytilus edulis TaxID=6550 RepID=A0A8S3TJW2_MYTED|nr:unnamed protein product [Mytilus edulis]
MKASINVHDSLLKSLERGNQMVKSFVEGCSNESETYVFYSPMSRSPLNTFDDTTKTSKLKCKSGDFVKAHINPVKLVRRALVLANVRENETVVRILAYPIPSALFHDDGTMWKCCKCDIIHLLEEEICSFFNLPRSDNCRNYLTHRAILEEDDDENDDWCQVFESCNALCLLTYPIQPLFLRGPCVVL